MTSISDGTDISAERPTSIDRPPPLVKELYTEFMTAVSRNPSLSVVLGLAESITGCAVIVTDAEGTVLTSSPSYTGGASVAPPSTAEVLRDVLWIDGSAVTCPVLMPGQYYVWLLGTPDPSDPRHWVTLTITAELTYLLKTFSFPGIPSGWLERGHLVERMLRGAEPTSIRVDAARLGYNIDRTVHVVVIAPRSGVPAPRLALNIGPRIHRFGPLTTRNDRLAMAIFGEDDLEDLLDVLNSIVDVGPFRVGVSAPASSTVDLRRPYEQALSVADNATVESKVVTRFEEQDPISVIAHIADSDTIDLFITRSLGPLLDYDRAHRNELLVTLCKWLDWTMSLDALANHLNIHKSTLTYRLRRIKELLEDDLADGKRRFEIGLALRLLGQRESRKVEGDFAAI